MSSFLIAGKQVVIDARQGIPRERVSGEPQQLAAMRAGSIERLGRGFQTDLLAADRALVG
jgi:hypothetical protein